MVHPEFRMNLFLNWIPGFIISQIIFKLYFPILSDVFPIINIIIFNNSILNTLQRHIWIQTCKQRLNLQKYVVQQLPIILEIWNKVLICSIKFDIIYNLTIINRIWHLSENKSDKIVISALINTVVSGVHIIVCLERSCPAIWRNVW